MYNHLCNIFYINQSLKKGANYRIKAKVFHLLVEHTYIKHYNKYCTLQKIYRVKVSVFKKTVTKKIHI